MKLAIKSYYSSGWIQGLREALSEKGHEMLDEFSEADAVIVSFCQLTDIQAIRSETEAKIIICLFRLVVPLDRDLLKKLNAELVTISPHSDVAAEQILEALEEA